MQRDYTEFAVESANRAIKWIRRYEEGIRSESSNFLSITPVQDKALVLFNTRIRRLELVKKNLRQAIEEIDVEIAYLNREFG